MCNPMFAVSLLSTAASVYGQMQAAKASVAAANATIRSAYKDNIYRQSTELQSLREDAYETLKEKENLAIDRRAAMGEAIAASEGAIGGLPLILGDLLRQEGRYASTLEKNLALRVGQYYSNIDEAKATYEQRVQNAKASIVPGPNLLGVAAQVGGAYVNAQNIAAGSAYKIGGAAPAASPIVRPKLAGTGGVASLRRPLALMN